MSGRNLESYLEDATGFDALSDDEQARLFAGESLKGETDAALATDEIPDGGVVAEESIETPADSVVELKEDETPANEPVVLTKDGQHTIPFAELEAARERSRQLEQELQALRSASQPKADPVAAAPEAVKDVNAEIAAMIKERNEFLMMAEPEKATEIDMKILALQQEASDNRAMAAQNARDLQRQEQDAQRSETANAQARANLLVEKYPFLNPQGDASNQDAIDLVVARRDQLMAQGVSFADAIEQAVAKVAPLFEISPTKPTQTVDVAQKAAEIISKAKAQTPISLSQVPGGALAHHDEGEAMRSDSGLSLINRFQGKSPEEIERMISRAL